MVYKLLGFAVWRGGRWYLRKRFGGTRRKIVIGGLSAVVLAGIAAAQRQSGSE